MIPTPRRRKRIANRLAKHGLELIRLEQADRELVSLRLILVTKRDQLGRAFAFPRQWLLQSGPRVIADAVLAQYRRGYGHHPLRPH